MEAFKRERGKKKKKSSLQLNQKEQKQFEQV